MCVRGARTLFSRVCSSLVRVARLPQVALARSHPLPPPLRYAIRGDRRASRRRGVCFINNLSRSSHTRSLSSICIDNSFSYAFAIRVKRISCICNGFTINLILTAVPLFYIRRKLLGIDLTILNI